MLSHKKLCYAMTTVVSLVFADALFSSWTAYPSLLLRSATCLHWWHQCESKLFPLIKCLINNTDPIISGVFWAFTQAFVWMDDMHVLSVFQSVRWWSVLMRPGQTASISSRTDWSCTTRQTMLITEDSDIRLLACKHTHTHTHNTNMCMHTHTHSYSHYI